MISIRLKLAQIKATSIQASLGYVQTKVDRDKKSSGISKEESVLWIYLGQGGGQILRECIMCCLDNMTDERAMSLLYALGIRERHQEISLLLERLYSQDKNHLEYKSTMATIPRLETSWQKFIRK